MSHIVTVQTKVRDAQAIGKACQRLKLDPPSYGLARLFTKMATGWIVQLPDWVYPIVCDVASGNVQYDNFNGQWGDNSKLDSFLQAYAVEKAKLEARKAGHGVYERQLEDGSIRLTLQVGAAA